jgi:hypothetical protein
MSETTYVYYLIEMCILSPAYRCSFFLQLTFKIITGAVCRKAERYTNTWQKFAFFYRIAKFRQLKGLSGEI